MTLEPLTARQLITQFEELISCRPEVESLPVHILDMDDGNNGKIEERYACLVTHLELDAFSEEQGMVVSLLAEREPYVKHSATSDPDTAPKAG